MGKRKEVVTTSLLTGSLDQNLHQDLVPSACEGEGSGSANCSSCEASRNFSFQLRGTHPRLTRIGELTLQEATHNLKIEQTWKNNQLKNMAVAKQAIDC
jgi:hypothetical protein